MGKTVKKCKCCGKEICFIWKDSSAYKYKDALGYYCSYNCFRKKGMLKDKMINASCLGKEKEQEIKYLTMNYFMESGDSNVGISNYRAIEKLCSKEELDMLLKEKKVRIYFEKLKSLKEKIKNHDDPLCLE